MTGRIALRFSNFYPALLDRRHDGFHSFGMNPGFVFGDRREQVNGKFIRVRKIGSYEVESAVHQSRDHCDVARQTI